MGAGREHLAGKTTCHFRLMSWPANFSDGKFAWGFNKNNKGYDLASVNAQYCHVLCEGFFNTDDAVIIRLPQSLEGDKKALRYWVKMTYTTDDPKDPREKRLTTEATRQYVESHNGKMVPVSLGAWHSFFRDPHHEYVMQMGLPEPDRFIILGRDSWKDVKDNHISQVITLTWTCVSTIAESTLDIDDGADFS